MARDALKHAEEEGYDCVLIDTAGRMQVRQNKNNHSSIATSPSYHMLSVLAAGRGHWDCEYCGSSLCSRESICDGLMLGVVFSV